MSPSMFFGIGVIVALVVMIVIALVIIVLVLFKKLRKLEQNTSQLKDYQDSQERNFTSSIENIRAVFNEDIRICLENSRSYTDSRIDKLLLKEKAIS